MKNLMNSIFLLIISLTSITVFGQDLTIEWQNTIGGSDFDSPNHIDIMQQTSDGGYIIGAVSRSNISGDKTENSIGNSYDYWILKLDSTGNIEWQNTIGGSDDEHFTSIYETSDNGFIIGGGSESDISGDKTEDSRGDEDYWIVKLNSAGVVVWDKTYGGSDHDRLYSILQTDDGGYIVGGSSLSDISGDKTENSNGHEDYWILKLDASGDIVWQNTIGGSGCDFFKHMSKTSDGGYIICGNSLSDISGDKTENRIGLHDIWALKLNSSGDIIWQNNIGGSLDDYINTISEISAGGFILAGSSNSNISGDKTENSISNSRDGWLIKLNSTGSVVWDNTIGGNSTDGLSAAYETSDNGFILGASSSSDASGDKTEDSNGQGDYWAIKVDSNGVITAQNTIGGSSSDQLLDMKQTSDDGYILYGQSNSNISGDKTENTNGSYDLWVVKLSSEALNLIDLEAITDYSFYPNPAKNQINFYGNGPLSEVKIYSTNGVLINTYNVLLSTSIDISHLPSGVYFVEISIENQSILKKLIKN